METLYNQALRRAEKAEAEVRQLKEGSAVIKKVEAMEKRMDTKTARIEHKVDLLTSAVSLLQAELRNKDLSTEAVDTTTTQPPVAASRKRTLHETGWMQDGEISAPEYSDDDRSD